MPKATAKTPAKQGSDLRSFFASQATSTPSQGSARSNAIQISDRDTPAPAASASAPKRKKAAALISSDEDEDEDEKPSPPKKKIATSSSRSPNKATPKSAKATPSTSARKRVKDEDSTDVQEVDEEEDEEEARPSSPKKQTAKPPPRKARASTSKVVKGESGSDDSDAPPVKKPANRRPRKSALDDDDDDFEVDSEEDVKPAKKPANGSTKAKGQKSNDAGKQPAKKAAAKPRASEPEPSDGADPAPDPPKPKFNWAAKAAKLAKGPAAPGSKPVPEPKTIDCLAGLSFVFTGELSSFARDEIIEIAKRYGGNVTITPSSRTSFVVLGDDAGPSKLEKIKKHKLKTLSEDEFLDLIATRVGPSGNGGELDDKTKKKMEKERKAIEDGAKELERREKAHKKEVVAAGGAQIDPASQLWTQRYAPQTLKEICGNKSQVEKLQGWLHDWPASLKAGFKKPGKNAMNVFRAVLITGPPGIGKTTSAHLVAKLEGYTPIELNASDARSKKLVESSTNITNQSLDGWMGGGEATNAAGIKVTEKSCLIMDEVDGMSAGDRGGVGALNALIKKSRIPIICIANDRGAQKLQPLKNSTFNLLFKRPGAAEIRSRIMTIAFREKMKVPANVVDQLVNGAQSDIRQVLNMLSTWKLSATTMDFDDGKELAKANEKNTIMTPYNVMSKIFGPYMFSATSRETLNEKMELYFHDHSFLPLFVQENYVKAQPAKLRSLDGPPRVLKQLELMDKAASSISDGDLVDALIHGPEQHWSLMPLHSVCSFVRPASLLYGNLQAYSANKDEAISFPAWLGKNSNQGKMTRQLGDLQIRMRLKVSGNKSEIRQSYIPSLFPHVVKPLMTEGASSVDDVIDFMDEYYVSREDWDTIVELGLGEQADEVVLKKISTATKTSLTKKYNGKEHPIPFHKATDLGKVPKKLAGGPAPDLEEAIEEDEVPEASEDEKDAADDDDISKDKLVKAAKAGKGKAAAKGKPKK